MDCHLKKLVISVLGTVFMLILAALPGYANDNQEAYELFEKGRETFKEAGSDEKKLRKSEKLLIKAIKLAPNDTGSLHWQQDVLRPIATGKRYPEYIPVKKNFKKKYYPNKVLKKVRTLLPPVPFVYLHFFENKVVVEVNNANGKSSLEDFEVLLTSPYGKIHKRYDEIPKNEKKKFSHRLSASPGKFAVNVHFKEKYGFTPWPINLN